MNQIPNIEETHNTREGIEIVREVDVLLQEGKYIEAMDVFLTAYKEQQEYYNHQLQKAREEAVTRAMDEMLEYTHLGEQFIDGVRTLIEARGIKLSANHSELDQDNK